MYILWLRLAPHTTRSGVLDLDNRRHPSDFDVS